MDRDEQSLPNAHKPIEPENKLERPTSKSAPEEGMCTFLVTCMDGQESSTDKYTSMPAASSERKW
ncbi:hypothetical protein E2C01_036971 [Portunus trituberculatus]|uniref:Uncharacterized protein n=1 Tax=Portunus trituberculatus TaxID=210409 RepID=A0A5B7FCQ0_PORTR|nr:hypothetical protein [Portunus trituberculatus]